VLLLTLVCSLSIFLPVSLYAQVFFAHPTVLVKNTLEPGDQITQVYISPSDSLWWEPDLLAEKNMKSIIHDLSAQFLLDASTKDIRLYDILVIDADGNRYTKQGIDVGVKGITIVEMSSSDKAAIPKIGGARTVAKPADASVIAASNNNADITVSDTSAIRKAIVSAAGKYLGVPYIWGMPGRPISFQPNQRPRGMDCSGFIAQAYKDATGITIPSNSSAIWAYGKKVDAGQVQPGDIVVMNSEGGSTPNHVALYVDNNSWFQALSNGPADKRGVVETEPSYINNKRILGYVTFVGQTTGNKTDYAPTAIMPLDFDFSAQLPVVGKMNASIKAGSQLKLNFHNNLDSGGMFRYELSMETSLPEAQESIQQTFNLQKGKSFDSGLLVPKIPGTYRLRVFMGNKVILDRTLEVLA
jgi:cell wall-associated NlpC family hydrolase